MELAGHCVCRAVGLPRLPLLSSEAEITGCSGNRVDWAEERKNTCLRNGSDTGCPLPQNISALSQHVQMLNGPNSRRTDKVDSQCQALF